MKGIGAALVFAALAFLAGCGDVPLTGAGTVDTTGSIKPVARGEAYLIRGGFNVFSTGMDELAAKLRAKGIDARSDGHADWQKLAADARRRYVSGKAPIVLIGHSFGALAAILIADDLAKTNTPVPLIILFDATESVKVPPNVRQVINFVSSTAIGVGLTVTGEPGFSGKIDTVNVPQFDHLSVDNAATLQAQSIAAVLKVMHPAGRG